MDTHFRSNNSVLQRSLVTAGVHEMALLQSEHCAVRQDLAEVGVRKATP